MKLPVSNGQSRRGDYIIDRSMIRPRTLADAFYLLFLLFRIPVLKHLEIIWPGGLKNKLEFL